MKKITSAVLAIVTVSSLTGCLGYFSKNNQGIGQIKYVHTNTPLLCPSYTSVGVSLGVMQNGVGSMSTQDLELAVEDDSIISKLDSLQKLGKPIELYYDNMRGAICTELLVLRSVDLAKSVSNGSDSSKSDTLKNVQPVIDNTQIDSLKTRVSALEQVVMKLSAKIQ